MGDLVRRWLLISLGIILLSTIVLAINGNNNPPEPQVTSTYTPSSETHCDENGKCTLSLYSGTIFTKEPDGNYYTLPEVSKVKWQNGGFNFTYRNYWVLIEPLVIYKGNIYTIQQIKQAFPNVNLKDHVSFTRFSHKFAANITAPQNLIDNTDYIVLHLKDSHGLTWNDIEKTNQSIIIKDKIVVSYVDLLESHFTLNLVNKSYLLIGNISANFQNGYVWLDPTIILQDADTENLEDTYIDEGSPTTTRAAANIMLLARSNDNQEGLYKFNITQIPSGQQIDEAALYVYMFAEGIDSGEEYFLDTHHIYNQTWSEDTMTWNNAIIMNWNKTRESRWTATGADPSPDAPNWITPWTVTNMVQKDYTDGNPNCSIWINLTLSSGSPGSFDDLQTYSKEDNEETLRPYLNITYSAAVGDTCDCPASGDWTIDCSESCIIDSACDVQGNDVFFTDTGTITVAANVHNFGQTHFSSGCIVVIGSGNKWGEK